MSTQKQLQESAIRKIERIISEEAGYKDLNVALTNLRNIDVMLIKLRGIFREELATKHRIEAIMDDVNELRKSVDSRWMSFRLNKK